MFRAILRRLAIRASIVFLLLHVGLIFAVFGLASLPRTEETATTWWILAGGISALYGAMVLSGFFLVWPLFRLARRIRQILWWKNLIMKELPEIIAMIPKLAQAIREAFGAVQPVPQPAAQSPITDKPAQNSSNQAA